MIEGRECERNGRRGEERQLRVGRRKISGQKYRRNKKEEEASAC